MLKLFEDCNGGRAALLPLGAAASTSTASPHLFEDLQWALFGQPRSFSLSLAIAILPRRSPSSSDPVAFE